MIYLIIIVVSYIVFPCFLLGIFLYNYPMIAYFIIGIVSFGEVLFLGDLIWDHFEHKNDENDFML